jgi:hypothetical protein
LQSGLELPSLPPQLANTKTTNNNTENKLDSVINILCYLHSLRSEEFVNKGNYAVWTSGNLCDKKSNNPSIIKAVVNVSKTGDKQVVKAKVFCTSIKKEPCFLATLLTKETIS